MGSLHHDAPLLTTAAQARHAPRAVSPMNRVRLRPAAAEALPHSPISVSPSRRYADTPSYPAVSLLRVNLLIQFTSQVLPPSPEKACSDWAVSAVMLQIESRTKTDLP
jgi:hypothetical protein